MKWYWWTLVVAFVVLGICASMPVPEASKPCLFGYDAMCSFSPISTVVCLATSAIFFFVGKRSSRKQTSES